MPSASSVALTLLAAALVGAQDTTTRRSSAAPAAGTSAAAASGGGQCYEGFAKEPLAGKRFEYDALPYKVDTDTTACRGQQLGYNICNSTTAGQDSMCQTAVINSIDDFCLWAPPEAGEEVGSIEGEMVAWCTKPGRGTRLIPEGALKGVQFVRSPAYVQVTGFIDQSMINMLPDDFGGEMDPHGADGKGNPIGGLVFSQAFTAAGNINNGTEYRQVVEWHNFMGGSVFCLKACDPANENGRHFCEHIFDRLGCTYNAPAAYVNGTFESCESDNQLYPGVYIENGQTSTYTQPPESLGPISVVPYTPFIPSSSSCTPYTSSDLYTALASVAISGTSGASSSAPTSAASSSVITTTDSAGQPTTRTTAAGALGANARQSGTTASASPTGAASKMNVVSAAMVGSVAAFVLLGAML